MKGDRRHERILVPHGDWTGLLVGVLGLGRSGQAAAGLLADRGARVTVFDDRSEDVLPAEFLAGRSRWRATKLAHDIRPSVDVAEIGALVVSPGVPPSHPLMRAAQERGIEILSELELAARVISGPVVAVTGTNGKSTTSSLTHLCLREAGRRASLAGNIGTAACRIASGLEADEIAVLEVSSFQLEQIHLFHPRVAVVLNVAPDHLDRYPDVEAYAAAKHNLLVNLDAGDAFVFPAGDPRLERWAQESAARPLRFAVDAAGPRGADAWVEDGWLVRRRDGRPEPVLPVSDFPLLGAHNRENALAALCATLPFALPVAAVAAALRSARALPHRAQLVVESGGVRYVDDSKATNVHAAMASLRGLDGPVVLLLGGSGKGEDYRPLRTVMANVRLAICYGAEGPALAAALRPTVVVEERPTLVAALERARDVAEEGDTVLLSPACASFDEFRNFEHRGDSFTAWVESNVGGRT